MFATELHAERHPELFHPNLEQIETAIRLMNGSNRSYVGIRGIDLDTHLMIGGGLDGQYVVSATLPNDRIFTALSTDKKCGRVSMIAGGQPGEFDAGICVKLEVALRAARTFAESGGVEKSIKWLKEFPRPRK